MKNTKVAIALAAAAVGILVAIFLFNGEGTDNRLDKDEKSVSSDAKSESEQTDSVETAVEETEAERAEKENEDAASENVAIAEDKPKLTVYTYESFVSEWGPGPAVEKAFEATCECDLNCLLYTSPSPRD